MIEVSDTKAYSIQGLLIKGQKYVSIRQMYKTKGDPHWKPGRQGISFALEDVIDVVTGIRSCLEDGEFREWTPQEKE